MPCSAAFWLPSQLSCPPPESHLHFVIRGWPWVILWFEVQFWVVCRWSSRLFGLSCVSINTGPSSSASSVIGWCRLHRCLLASITSSLEPHLIIVWSRKIFNLLLSRWVSLDWWQDIFPWSKSQWIRRPSSKVTLETMTYGDSVPWQLCKSMMMFGRDWPWALCAVIANAGRIGTWVCLIRHHSREWMYKGHVSRIGMWLGGRCCIGHCDVRLWLCSGWGSSTMHKCRIQLPTLSWVYLIFLDYQSQHLLVHQNSVQSSQACLQPVESL